MIYSHRSLCLAALLAALPLTGCTAQGSTTVEPVPAPPVVVAQTQGTLTLRWTLNGNVDPNECMLSGATAIRVDLSGGAGTYTSDCANFATTITVPAGGYSANAQMVDAKGNARTTSVPVNPFTIVGGGDLLIDVDFPASSFYGTASTNP